MSSLPSPSVTLSSGSANCAGLVAARPAITSRSFDCARAAEVVLVLVEAVLAVDLHALEVLLHDEVDDAGDRVRAVDRGGAARQDVDALDHRRSGSGSGPAPRTRRSHRHTACGGRRSAPGCGASRGRAGSRSPYRWRRSTRVTFCAAKACGSWLTRSSMRVTPCVTTSAAVTCVTGCRRLEVRAADARAGHDDFTQVFLRKRRCRPSRRQRTHDECATYGRRDLVFTFHCCLPPAGSQCRPVGCMRQPTRGVAEFAVVYRQQRPFTEVCCVLTTLRRGASEKPALGKGSRPFASFAERTAGLPASHVAECQRPWRASSTWQTTARTGCGR